MCADRKAVFGVFIGEADCWGQGYGPEVTRLVLRHSFRTLNLNRISLHVKEFNVRGIRAYEKVGFVQEGILRQDHYHDGRYHNVILVAILKDEWEALEAGDTAS